MKLPFFVLMSAACAVSLVRADLTMVEKIDGVTGVPSEITIFIKGDKMRIDSTPQVSAIVDGHTGEVVTLMKEEKRAIRISAEKMKAAAAMITKFNGKGADAVPSKPKATGRKETINGYEAEEYVMETGMMKASYWLAPKFPDGLAILHQLQAVSPDIWKSANPNAASFSDFPALPIRTVVDMGATKMTTDLVSVKKDPIPDTAFTVPADFEEIKAPEMGIPGQSPAHP